MFYSVVRSLVRGVIFVVNGNAHYQNTEVLPKDRNYILVAPHRTWLDPVFMAVGASPKKFSFMAKEELFEKNVLFKFVLEHMNAFPVKRDKPGPSAVKTPVKILKETDLGLIMFPSGTRHSSDLKGGMALIARLAKVDIVPCVYQGPLSFKALLKRGPVIVRYGEPISIKDIKKLDKDGLAEVERRVMTAFAKLDKEIDPNYKYIPK